MFCIIDPDDLTPAGVTRFSSDLTFFMGKLYIIQMGIQTLDKRMLKI